MSAQTLSFPANFIPSAISVELARGVREPISASESTEELTPEQAGALANVADDFNDRIAHAADSLADDDLAETWSAEQTDADSLYRILFGDAAYNRQSIEAALDALD